MHQRLAAILLSFGMLCSQVSGYSGEMPTQNNYGYDYYGETIAAPKAYEFFALFGAEDLGIDDLKGLSDICADSYGNIYLCDTVSGRIIKVDSNYRLIKEQSVFSYQGKTVTLNQPEGISVGNDGMFYVADTANGRILKMDTNFNIIKIIGAPDKETAQYDFEYMPSKISVDSEGRMYVVVKSQTQGIFNFDANGNFLGYIGASKVKTSFKQLLYRMFASREQLKGILQFIPTEYSNISIDSSGFIYGTISAVESSSVISDIESHGNNAKTVRRMNQSGKDISVVNGNQAPLGDLEFSVSALNIYEGPSSFVDVSTYENGVYSVLDSRRGRIFTYNSRSELMYIFGDRGTAKESLTVPTAITYSGDKILAADKSDGTVHVYEPTDYARLIMTGNAQYEAGEYDAEEETWAKLLVMYSGSELANVGMGRALYKQGKYSEALFYFKKAQNREYYSKALKYYIREKGAQYAPYILGGIVLLAVVLLILKKKVKFKARRETRFIKLMRQIRYGSYVSFHPFDGFWELKSEKRGSVASASCVLGLAVAVNVVYVRLTPFLFSDTDFTRVSALQEGAIGLIAMTALWTVCNWALTTIMNGKGTFKDIYKYTCYSLWPIIVIYPIVLIASYLLTEESAAFLTILSTAALVWTVFLVFCGTCTTHQYTAGKTVVTMFLTVVAIMIVMFVLLLTFSLVQQIFTFVSLLLREITMSI